MVISYGILWLSDENEDLMVWPYGCPCWWLSCWWLSANLQGSNEVGDETPVVMVFMSDSAMYVKPTFFLCNALPSLTNMLIVECLHFSQRLKLAKMWYGDGTFGIVSNSHFKQVIYYLPLPQYSQPRRLNCCMLNKQILPALHSPHIQWVWGSFSCCICTLTCQEHCLLFNDVGNHFRAGVNNIKPRSLLH